MSGRFPGWWICKACRLPNCSVAALTRNGILLPNHSDEIVQDLHLFPFYPLPLRPGAMQRHQSFYLVFRIIPKSIFWCNRLLPWNLNQVYFLNCFFEKRTFLMLWSIQKIYKKGGAKYENCFYVYPLAGAGNHVAKLRRALPILWTAKYCMRIISLWKLQKRCWTLRFPNAEQFFTH